MFRTITARHTGTCKRCRQAFEAGTRIRYGGPGRTYHLSAACPRGGQPPLSAEEDRVRRQMASDQRAWNEARRGPDPYPADERATGGFLDGPP